MKLLIDKFYIVVILMITMLVGGRGVCRAQQINVAEIATLEGQGVVLNKKITEQAEKEMLNMAEVTTQAGEMNSIARWQKKFSNYLMEAKTYAQQAQAAYGVYSQIVRVILNLTKLEKAIRSNPGGIVYNGLLTESYIHVADEIILSLYLLKNVFSKGGENNMLSGKDRAQVWWDLNDTLERLNDNLYRMAYNIAYYTLTDVWKNMTQGMLQKTNGSIAREALDRWKRIPQVEHILNK